MGRECASVWCVALAADNKIKVAKGIPTPVRIFENIEYIVAILREAININIYSILRELAGPWVGGPGQTGRY